MSTMGLAISVGVLVNNAILVLENIYRYRELGMDPLTAAEEGTREISLAVLSTTATNLGVFIPIAFMGGIVGQFFNQFALTVVFSTLFSLWGAFTVTPMAAARLGGSVHVSPFAKKVTAWWYWIYRELEVFQEVYVGKAMRHPWVTIGFFGLLFAGSLLMIPRVGFELFPRVDEGVIRINLELSSTASLEATDEQVRKVEAFLREQPYVKSMSSTVGGRRLSSVNSGVIRVYLVDADERKSAFAIASDLRKKFAGLPDTNVTINVASGQGGGIRKPVQITISGPDLDVLNSIAGELMEKIRDVPGLADLDTDWKVGRFDLNLIPEDLKLTSMGVTLSDVSDELRGYLSGIKAGVYREQGYEYNILVKLASRWVDSPEAVPLLPMWTPHGFVPINELATVAYEPSPTAIYRLDRQRKISVQADVAGRTVGEVFRDITPRMDEIQLPTGYRFIIGGEIQNIRENFRRMIIAFTMAVVLTFLMIAGILESY
jgi:HAE1 family hydrophobic/amphiphilic exporter-1